VDHQALQLLHLLQRHLQLRLLVLQQVIQLQGLLEHIPTPMGVTPHPAWCVLP
jgi:hypothetical protein